MNACDGSGPHWGGEIVRVLSTGIGSNLILCRACYKRELSWRRQRNRDLEDFAQLALPTWISLPIYSQLT